MREPRTSRTLLVTSFSAPDELPKHRHGKHAPVHDGIPCNFVVCSRCKSRAFAPVTAGLRWPRFCPSCGARSVMHDIARQAGVTLEA